MEKENNNVSLYQLLNHKENKLQAGATDEMLFQFEKTNRIKLPTEYKKLMKYSNGAELFNRDIIIFTLFQVANSKNVYEIPYDKLLVIGKYNFGDLVCIDLESENVIQWEVKSKSVFLEYVSIKDWIISSIEEMKLI